jgi:hypothetical protein
VGFVVKCEPEPQMERDTKMRRKCAQSPEIYFNRSNGGDKKKGCHFISMLLKPFFLNFYLASPNEV